MDSVTTDVSTCYKADGGAVAAAERRLAPRHHGNAEVIVPGRQQIGHPLTGNTAAAPESEPGEHLHDTHY